MTNRPKRLGLCLLAGFCTLAISLECKIQSASAREMETPAVSERLISQKQKVRKHTANANALVSSEASIESKPPPRGPRTGVAKGPYYVDFRARTAASWGHAFVWFGKTSERAVEVAGLTPAGDTLAYVLGYVAWVPSETGASYGDLDPQYLTASYRVYLNEPDAKRVFAYIKQLQANSPLWNAETSNCTSFIGSIAKFMGLNVPIRWKRPEDYVNSLKEMNGGRRMVQLTPKQ